jgi:methyltransferase (TIGR00027 family)
MAYLRAHHARNGRPRIFDDFLAARLVSAAERASIERRAIDALRRSRPGPGSARGPRRALLRDALNARGAQAEIVARARFTEDRLLQAVRSGVSQYVILGAGLDTFALRRPDLADRLAVFELDLPAFQAAKKARLAAAGLPSPANLHFVAAHFERESLADVLLRSAYRTDRKTFFSCLGVTFYLSRRAVLDLLRSVGLAAPAGSRLAFDYLDLDAFDPDKASKQIGEIMRVVGEAGEPMRCGLDPRRLPAQLRGLGLRVVEHVDAPTKHFHFILAELAGGASCAPAR